MSDFKSMREMMEWCLGGGKVSLGIYKTELEWFDERGRWVNRFGEVSVSHYSNYSKHIPPKKTKKVKLLAYLASCGELRLYEEGKTPVDFEWHRVPSEDKEIEIEIED